MSTLKIAGLRNEVKRTMGNDYVGQAAVPPKPKKKREHTFVFYAANGEHLMFDCDRIRIMKNDISLYNVDNNDEDEGMDLFAVINKDKLIAWEQIR